MSNATTTSTVQGLVGTVHTEKDLEPLEWQALRLLGKNSDLYRGDCPVGTGQEVDFRVTGKIDVFADHGTTKTVTTGPSPETLLAHVMKRLPPETVQLIRESIRAAYEADNELPIEEGYLDASANFCASMKKTTKTTGTVRGAVKGRFSVGIIDTSSISLKTAEEIVRSTTSVAFDEEGVPLRAINRRIKAETKDHDDDGK